MKALLWLGVLRRWRSAEGKIGAFGEEIVLKTRLTVMTPIHVARHETSRRGVMRRASEASQDAALRRHETR